MIDLNEHKSLTEVLTKAEAQNERVFIYLEGGKEYFGRVQKTVDPNFYTVRQIVDKEYYDAIFRMDKVISIEVRNVDR